MTTAVLTRPAVSTAALSTVRDRTIAFLTDHGKLQLRIQDWGTATASISKAIKQAPATAGFLDSTPSEQLETLWNLTLNNLGATK